jgi:branched-chain amino acid transport system permease protein
VHLVQPIITGIGQGSVLFLVAVGLTLSMGVMRLLNFGNGAFFMLGAYLSYSVVAGRPPEVLTLLLAIVVGGLATGVVGLVCERVVVRRLYPLPHLFPLLGTYAMLLVIQGLAVVIWGLTPRGIGQAPAFSRSITVAGVNLPTYSLLLIGVGLATVAVVAFLIARTRFGRQVRAIAADREMAAVLGINVNLVFMLTFVLSTFLAGLGGGLVAPLVGITPDVAGTYLIEAFAVLIVGGIGSILGSYVSAIGFGVITAVLVAVRPEIAEASVFAVMALTVLLRPQGLLGRRQSGLI